MSTDDRRQQVAPINRDSYPEHSPAGFDERSREPLAPNDTLDDVEQERARIYPAPLSGVEPLEGHAVEPDAEEVSVEDALIKDRAAAGWEQTGQLDTRSATLDGAQGLGVMRVVRSADGDPVGMPGTWRPGEGVATGGSYRTGDVFTYEGPLHDGEEGVRDVSEEVRVTSTGRYVTEDGEEYEIVNFESLRGPERVM